MQVDHTPYESLFSPCFPPSGRKHNLWLIGQTMPRPVACEQQADTCVQMPFTSLAKARCQSYTCQHCWGLGSQTRRLLLSPGAQLGAQHKFHLQWPGKWLARTPAWRVKLTVSGARDAPPGRRSQSTEHIGLTGAAKVRVREGQVHSKKVRG